MRDLSHLIMVAVAIIVAIMLIITASALLNRRRLQRGPRLREERRHELQAQLLDAIKFKSANQGTVVDIRRFWLETNCTAAQRNSIIQPLISAGHVTAHEETMTEPWETLNNLRVLAFFRPPKKTHIDRSNMGSNGQFWGNWANYRVRESRFHGVAECG